MARAMRTMKASLVSAVVPAVRCAVYVRKSTDEGLDRDFNSLDNQRAAAEAYITSQRHEGWTCLPENYADGGFSGGNTERPALKRLLDDVRKGLIDSVVVYRLDRLSRSLADFVGLHRFFEEHGVALVSVTESINTTTPHGRMMVNMLLSFAQYERELTAERTRHKIHAARKRGKWTGGIPVLGYDTAPEGGKLVVNRDEADRVKVIFDLYLEHQSLLTVVTELNRRGWRRKSWTTKDGRERRGKAWDRPNLLVLLRNPLYAGLQKLGDDTFKGEHQAIVPRKVWEQVQRALDENRRTAGAGHRNRHGALLRGLLRCAACGSSMVHGWTQRHKRIHRYYYCTRAQKVGRDACASRSVPAGPIEDFVVSQIGRVGADPDIREEVFRQAEAHLGADRRGVRAEVKRGERELAQVRTEVERLVATVAGVTGSAAEPLLEAIAAANNRVADLERRLAELAAREHDLAGIHLDPEDVGAALASFTPIWEVLGTPERERVIQLLIEEVTYDRTTGQIRIEFRPTGIATFGEEVAG
jgi:site-specific DNA recombinase